MRFNAELLCEVFPDPFDDYFDDINQSVGAVSRSAATTALAAFDSTRTAVSIKSKYDVTVSLTADETIAFAGRIFVPLSSPAGGFRVSVDFLDSRGVWRWRRVLEFSEARDGREAIRLSALLVGDEGDALAKAVVENLGPEGRVAIVLGPEHRAVLGNELSKSNVRRAREVFAFLAGRIIPERDSVKFGCEDASPDVRDYPREVPSRELQIEGCVAREEGSAAAEITEVEPACDSFPDQLGKYFKDSKQYACITSAAVARISKTRLEGATIASSSDNARLKLDPASDAGSSSSPGTSASPIALSGSLAISVDEEEVADDVPESEAGIGDIFHKEFYEKLEGIFLNVDVAYLRAVCTFPESRNVQLADLTKILLTTGGAHPRVVVNIAKSKSNLLNERYEALMDIFPDADPDYVRNFAAVYYNDPDAMREFVRTKLETNDYPKKFDEEREEVGEKQDADSMISDDAAHHSAGFLHAQYYEKLRDMFLDVDQRYIRDICTFSENENVRLDELVEKLLETGQDHPKYDLETRYKNIADIFPDADPDYVREFVAMNYRDSNALEVFVQAQLDIDVSPAGGEETTKNKAAGEPGRAFGSRYAAPQEYLLPKAPVVSETRISGRENPQREQTAFNASVGALHGGYYGRLCAMFPDVDPRYIEDVCMMPERETVPLEELVEELLYTGPNHPKYDLETRYKTIADIFPDADPDYVREFVAMNYRDSNALEVFVQAQLDFDVSPTGGEETTKNKAFGSRDAAPQEYLLPKAPVVSETRISGREKPQREQTEFHASVGAFHQEYYDKLCVMFPDVDLRYIEDICTFPERETVSLEELEELLLNTGLDHPREVVAGARSENYDSSDADPNYRREFRAKHRAEPVAIQGFAHNNLVARYPKGKERAVVNATTAPGGAARERNHGNAEAGLPLPAELLAWRRNAPVGVLHEELYRELTQMFSHIKPRYVRDVCTFPETRQVQLEELIEIMLECERLYPEAVMSPEERRNYDFSESYKTLLSVFPDADPDYIRKFAEQNYNDSVALKEFVQTKLETHDYPTKERYLERIRIAEEQRRYTTDFDVEWFLEMFPDPFSVFEVPNRKRNWDAVQSFSLPSLEDIPLLQEYAFVRNKEAISACLAKRRMEEEREFKKLKARSQLLECQCCFDAECLPSRCSICTEGHVFCHPCIVRGTEARMGDGQTTFPCFTDCEGEFTLPCLQKILKPTTFSVLLQKRQEAEVMAAGLEGLVSCPFCHFASIPPPEDKIFKCLNPECMKESCRLCKEANHVPYRCGELKKSEEARHYLEERMTQALVRTCNSCKRIFVKEDGCNMMTCKCRAMMCYICGETIQGYEHFNGQGSGRNDLCPLHSDTPRIDAEFVFHVAKLTEAELLKKDPSIKVDVANLLPQLPPSMSGAHEQVSNAHVLPKHMKRMERDRV